MITFTDAKRTLDWVTTWKALILRLGERCINEG